MKNLTIFRSTASWVPNLEGLSENLSVPGKLGYSWKVLGEQKLIEEKDAA